VQVELYCEKCQIRFASSPETPALDIVERMIDDGPWFALGDGETFEDMIFTALTARGAICCPECCRPVAVQEESLGRMAMAVLAQS
jgi:hypothetical protein